MTTRELEVGEYLKAGDITVVLDKNGEFEKHVPIKADALPIVLRVPYSKKGAFGTILRVL